MLFFLFLTLLSVSIAESTKKTECAEGLKAKASLKFSECQDPLLPLKECYQLYPDTLTSGPRDSFLWRYGNNSHKGEKCRAVLTLLVVNTLPI